MLDKAVEKEARKWLYKVFEVAIGLACTIAVAVPTGSQAGTTAGVIAGLISLLIIGAFRFTFFALSGARAIHCDQIDRFEAYRREARTELDAMKAERDSLTVQKAEVVKELEEKPLSKFDAIRYLRAFSRWLYAESNVLRGDTTLHKDRFGEVIGGLLGESPQHWGKTQFQNTGNDCSQGLLWSRAEYASKKNELLTQGEQFNEHWKPPAWLLELESHP